MEGSRSVRGSQHPQRPHREEKMARRRMPNILLQLRQQVCPDREPPWLPVQQTEVSEDQTLMGHSGATNRTFRVNDLTRWRVGRSNGNGGKAYSRPAGHAFARASIPSGELASARENHKGQCVLLLEAKRSTWALPNQSQICRTT
ncbi:hypothetical protein AMECASPLE_014769 [Ameca splendens]|uniref:Uncharacterized protein n=1 Tax=Ameca splendens TaxID=208324 RepID=A0ABV0ZBA9_9TELE